MIPDEIKNQAAWCVSKDKEPLDMWALARGKRWGASDKRSHSSYVTYGEALTVSKKTGLPVTWYVNPSVLPYAVIDIEKSCPVDLRRAMLLALHDCCVYLERSLSGKGYHMLLRLAAAASWHTAIGPLHWFEVLAKHHATFTGHEISFGEAYAESFPENAPMPQKSDAVYDLTAELMEKMRKPLTAEEFYAIVDKGSTAGTPGPGLAAYHAALSSFDGRHADLFNDLCDTLYAKIPADFGGDMSAYEFGYASKLMNAAGRISKDMMDAHGKHYELPLTKEEAVMLVYMALRQVLPPREKHAQYRNGLPWLLYTSERVYDKTFPPPNGQKKEEKS